MPSPGVCEKGRSRASSVTTGTGRSRAEQTIELLPGDPRLPATLADGTTPWPAPAGALLVKARYLPGGKDGRDAWEHARAFGRSHCYSIGYKVTHTGARHRGGIRYITDRDLYEFSPVPHGRTGWPPCWR